MTEEVRTSTVSERPAETPELLPSYFSRIDKGRLLSRGEEMDLARGGQAGGRRATARRGAEHARRRARREGAGAGAGGGGGPRPGGAGRRPPRQAAAYREEPQARGEHSQEVQG